MTRPERCGWMAGEDMQDEPVGVWKLRTHVAAYPRRTLSASRCTSCGLVDPYAR